MKSSSVEAHIRARTLDALLVEYQAANDQLATTASRVWQSTGVVAAAFVTGAIGIGTVLPNDFFPRPFKLMVIWVGASGITLVLIYWLILMIHEKVVEAAAVRRMIEIELATGLRRVLVTCFLVDWKRRTERPEWGMIGANDQERFERLVRGAVLTPRPAWLFGYGPYFFKQPRLHTLFMATVVAPFLLTLGFAISATLIVLNS